MSDQTEPTPTHHVGSPPQAPKTRNTKRNLLLAGAATLGVLAGCCGGFSIATTVAPETRTVVVNSPSPYAVTEYVTVAPQAPATTAPAKPATPTIDEGIWIVGVDFPAGTYRTRDTVNNCYWAIYKAETNQANIVENDIVDGGRPTVKLTKGHEFKTSRCGTWVKIK